MFSLAAVLNMHGCKNCSSPNKDETSDRGRSNGLTVLSSTEPTQISTHVIRPPRSKSNLRCSGIRSGFRTFCLQTSLHGWQYLMERPTATCQHVFWVVIVTLSMVTAGTFLFNNTWVSIAYNSDFHMSNVNYI